MNGGARFFQGEQLAGKVMLIDGPRSSMAEYRKNKQTLFRQVMQASACTTKSSACGMERERNEVVSYSTDYPLDFYGISSKEMDAITSSLPPSWTCPSWDGHILPPWQTRKRARNWQTFSVTPELNGETSMRTLF